MKRYLVEGLVIVFSILVALLVDAAWDYRLDRVAEREYLEALRGEFRESGRELASDQRIRREILTGVNALLRASARGGQAELPEDSIGLWLARAVDYRFYSPVHSVLDDLISSGNLSLIRSDALRFAILDYVQEMGRLHVVEARERDFVADQLEPFLAGRIRIPDYYMWVSPDSVRAPSISSASEDELTELLADPQLASLLALRHERTRTATGFGDVLEGVIRRVRETIDAELDGG